MKSNERMVWAYGDKGVELCPESEVIEIKPIPLGPKNIVVPETVAWLSSIRNGGGLPTRLRDLNLPRRDSEHMAVLITFDCTPLECYQAENGPVFSEWFSCYLRHATDAQHPVFRLFKADERKRMLLAVQECEAMFGAKH